MNKEELKEQAESMFKNHKTEQVFYATSDGNFFTEKNLEAAKSHADANKLEAPVRFSRDEFEAESKADDGSGLVPASPVTAKEIIEKINAAETKEEVETILGQDTRKSVVDAAAKKIKALKNA